MHSPLIVLAVALGVCTGPALASEPNAAPSFYHFDKESIAKEPAGFLFGRTGAGVSGQWIIRAVNDAPSAPNIVAQIDSDKTDYRFPLAVLEETILVNLEACVKCKTMGGKIDQACGLVFRFRDENNYYVARLNALKDNVVLYVVKNGQRKEVRGARTKVDGSVWHELRVDAIADHLRVFLDGKKMIDARDKTFREAGRVGLWTEADSVTYFDDLAVAPL